MLLQDSARGSKLVSNRGWQGVEWGWGWGGEGPDHFLSAFESVLRPLSLHCSQHRHLILWWQILPIFIQRTTFTLKSYFGAKTLGYFSFSILVGKLKPSRCFCNDFPCSRSAFPSPFSEGVRVRQVSSTQQALSQALGLAP